MVWMNNGILYVNVNAVSYPRPNLIVGSANFCEHWIFTHTSSNFSSNLDLIIHNCTLTISRWSLLQLVWSSNAAYLFIAMTVFAGLGNLVCFGTNMVGLAKKIG